MDLRLGRGSYLIVWALLTLTQIWLVSEFFGSDTQGDAAIDLAGMKGAMIGGFLLLQLKKSAAAAARLNDLGRIPSEAILGLVPLVNVGLWYQLLDPTPAPDKRERRIGKWIDEPTPAQALGFGLKTSLYAAPTVLLLSVVFAGLHTLIGNTLSTFVELVQRDVAMGKPMGEVALVTNVFGGLAAVLFLYSVVNFTKRGTASRVSWLPSVFMVPAGLAAGAFAALPGGGPIASAFIFTAFDLAWICFMDAGLVVVFVTAADLVHRGESPTPGKLIGALRRRLWDVAAPFGMAWTAIMIGMQVVIPGIHYALQYAFVGPVAVLEPDANRVLTRAAALSRDMRRRIFVVVFVGFAVSFGGGMGMVAAIDGSDILAQAFIIPNAPSEMPMFLGGILGNLMFAVTSAALTLMYKGRVAKEAKRREQKAAASGPDAVVVDSTS